MAVNKEGQLTAVAVKSVETFLRYSGLTAEGQMATLILALRRQCEAMTARLPEADRAKGIELYHKTVLEGLLQKDTDNG